MSETNGVESPDTRLGQTLEMAAERSEQRVQEARERFSRPRIETPREYSDSVKASVNRLFESVVDSQGSSEYNRGFTNCISMVLEIAGELDKYMED